MANDRNDFAPEIRNAAWWASDTRRAVNGKVVEVILEKQGKKDLDDLSHIEAVQMGHVMQPVIGQLVTSKLNLEIKDADYMLTHSRNDWLRSHFDFISSDGKTLVEVKNYNASVRSKFDADTGRVPDADYAQCLHEAAVHGVDHVILAVLFGGQEFQTFNLRFTQNEMDQFAQDMAVYWAHVKSLTLPEAHTIEGTKLAFPVSNDGVITATAQVEQAIAQLKAIKAKQKEMDEYSEDLEVKIRNLMGEASEIRTLAGDTLVTWRSSKPVRRFSPELFKSSMPDVYDQFMVEMLGSRRFLVK